MTDDEFLAKLKEYIEGVEVQLSGEFGDGKSLEALVAENDMPPVYYEVLRRIELKPHDVQLTVQSGVIGTRSKS